MYRKNKHGLTDWLQLAALSVISLSSPSLFADFDVPSGEYTLEDTHGYITFSYNHMGFSNPQLSFNKFDVTLKADSDNPTNSQVMVHINSDSIDSRVDVFDKLLNGSDYFDSSNHPTITFASTEIKDNGDNTFAVKGHLTIKEVSKPITLQTTINKAANHPMLKVPTIGVSATATLNRSDFNLGKFVPVVSDQVDLVINVELIKK